VRWQNWAGWALAGVALLLAGCARFDPGLPEQPAYV
jgi:hypothetical protein